MFKRFTRLYFLVPVFVLFTALTANAQWVRMTDGLPTSLSIKAIASNGSTIYAGSPDYQMLYVSKNNGLNWTAYPMGVYYIHCLALKGNKIFAGTGWGLIKIDTNTYSFTVNSFNSLYQMSIAASSSNIYVGTSDSNIFISSDAGTTWRRQSTAYNTIYALYATGSNVYAATSFGVFFSTDDGLNWTQSQYINWQNLSVIAKDNTILAGLPGGCIRSTNNGFSWIPISDFSGSVVSLIISGNKIFAGVNSYNSYSQGVLFTTNLGVNWVQKGEGLGYKDLLYINANDQYIFAGSYLYGIWRRPLTEMVGVENISEKVPIGYSLAQNFPNPFNPMCNVQFTMCNAGKVKLVVYDIQGREIQTLVNERLNAGTYEVKFDGSMLTSGVYFYRMTIRHGGSSTDGFTETKKMLLIK